MNKSIWSFQPPPQKTLQEWKAKVSSQPCGWYNNTTASFPGLEHPALPAEIREAFPEWGDLGLSPKGPTEAEAHQVREERTSRQMERQNPVPDASHLPLKMLFLLCSGSLAGLDVKGMLKMPTHYPCQLDWPSDWNLCGILIRAREREKGREILCHLPCLLWALNPSLGPTPVTWLPLNGPTS